MPVRRAIAGVALLAAALLAVPMPAVAADPPLVFEVGGGGPSDRTARIAWHLLGDNVTNPSISAYWHSGYLDEPGVLSGSLVTDPVAGTLEGTLTESWDVGGAYGDWSELTVSMTVVVVDGSLTPDGDGWSVGGSVDIAYEGAGALPESPSDCGGEECYLCKDRVCTFARGLSATVPLTGRLEGTTLTLAFADGLVEDVSQVDVTPLEDQEYFLSLFSVTLSGGMPLEPGDAPIEVPPDAEPAGANGGTGETEAPVPGEADPGEAEGTTDDAGDAGASEDPEPAPAAAPSGKRWPVTVWLVLLLGVVAGAAGVFIAMKGVIMLWGGRSMNPLLSKPSSVARSVEKAWQEGQTDPDPTLVEYEQDVREDRQRQFEAEAQAMAEQPGSAPSGSGSTPTPPAAPPPPPPPPPPFEPAHEIVLGEEVDHNRVPGTQQQGSETTVTLFQPGTPIQVVGEDGDYLLVRASQGQVTPMRIHKSGVRPKA